MSRIHKMLRGELLIYNNGSNAVEAINLGNPGKERCIFHNDTIRPTYVTSSNTIKRPKVNANGTILYIMTDATPWIRILDLTTGQYIANPATLPTAACYQFDISPDNTELVVGFSDPATGFLRYDIETLIAKPAPASPPGQAALGISYSYDGKYLAMTHSAAPWVTIYNTLDMSKVTIAVPPAGAMYACDFSPDNALFCCVGNAFANYFFVYNTLDWSKRTVLAPNNNSLYEVKFSPDNKYIAVGQSSPTPIKLYNIAANTWLTPPPPTNYHYELNGTGHTIYWLDNDTIFVLGQNKANTPTYPSYMLFYTLSTNSWTAHPLPGTANYGASSKRGPFSRKIAGTVVNASAAPVIRTVRAYHRETGEQVGETISNGTTGAFEMKVFETDPLTIVAIGQGNEITEIFDSVLAAPWT